MKIYLLVFVCVLAGCGDAMTNDEIIAETKKCEAAGLKAVQRFGWIDPRRIQCVPR